MSSPYKSGTIFQIEDDSPKYKSGDVFSFDDEPTAQIPPPIQDKAARLASLAKSLGIEKEVALYKSGKFDKSKGPLFPAVPMETLGTKLGEGQTSEPVYSLLFHGINTIMGKDVIPPSQMHLTDLSRAINENIPGMVFSSPTLFTGGASGAISQLTHPSDQAKQGVLQTLSNRIPASMLNAVAGVADYMFSPQGLLLTAMTGGGAAAATGVTGERITTQKLLQLGKRLVGAGFSAKFVHDGLKGMNEGYEDLKKRGFDDYDSWEKVAQGFLIAVGGPFISKHVIEGELPANMRVFRDTLSPSQAKELALRAVTKDLPDKGVPAGLATGKDGVVESAEEAAIREGADILSTPEDKAAIEAMSARAASRAAAITGKPLSTIPLQPGQQSADIIANITGEPIRGIGKKKSIALKLERNARSKEGPTAPPTEAPRSGDIFPISDEPPAPEWRDIKTASSPLQQANITAHEAKVSGEPIQGAVPEPRVSRAIPIPDKTFGEMTKAEFTTFFKKVYGETTRAEIPSTVPLPEETAAMGLPTKDTWEQWSKSRGYSDTDIQNYKLYLAAQGRLPDGTTAIEPSYISQFGGNIDKLAVNLWKKHKIYEASAGEAGLYQDPLDYARQGLKEDKATVSPSATQRVTAPVPQEAPPVISPLMVPNVITGKLRTILEAGTYRDPNSAASQKNPVGMFFQKVYDNGYQDEASLSQALADVKKRLGNKIKGPINEARQQILDTLLQGVYPRKQTTAPKFDSLSSWMDSYLDPSQQSVAQMAQARGYGKAVTFAQLYDSSGTFDISVLQAGYNDKTGENNYHILVKRTGSYIGEGHGRELIPISNQPGYTAIKEFRFGAGDVSTPKLIQELKRHLALKGLAGVNEMDIRPVTPKEVRDMNLYNLAADMAKKAGVKGAQPIQIHRDYTAPAPITIKERVEQLGISPENDPYRHQVGDIAYLADDPTQGYEIVDKREALDGNHYFLINKPSFDSRTGKEIPRTVIRAQDVHPLEDAATEAVLDKTSIELEAKIEAGKALERDIRAHTEGQRANMEVGRPNVYDEYGGLQFSKFDKDNPAPVQRASARDIKEQGLDKAPWTWVKEGKQIFQVYTETNPDGSISYTRSYRDIRGNVEFRPWSPIDHPWAEVKGTRGGFKSLGQGTVTSLGVGPNAIPREALPKDIRTVPIYPGTNIPITKVGPGGIDIVDTEVAPTANLDKYLISKGIDVPSPAISRVGLGTASVGLTPEAKRAAEGLSIDEWAKLGLTLKEVLGNRGEILGSLTRAAKEGELGESTLPSIADQWAQYKEARRARLQELGSKIAHELKAKVLKNKEVAKQQQAGIQPSTPPAPEPKSLRLIDIPPYTDPELAREFNELVELAKKYPDKKITLPPDPSSIKVTSLLTDAENAQTGAPPEDLRQMVKEFKHQASRMTSNEVRSVINTIKRQFTQESPTVPDPAAPKTIGDAFKQGAKNGVLDTGISLTVGGKEYKIELITDEVGRTGGVRVFQDDFEHMKVMRGEKQKLVFDRTTGEYVYHFVNEGSPTVSVLLDDKGTRVKLPDHLDISEPLDTLRNRIFDIQDELITKGQDVEQVGNPTGAIQIAAKEAAKKSIDLDAKSPELEIDTTPEPIRDRIITASTRLEPIGYLQDQIGRLFSIVYGKGMEGKPTVFFSRLNEDGSPLSHPEVRRVKGFDPADTESIDSLYRRVTKDIENRKGAQAGTLRFAQDLDNILDDAPRRDLPPLNQAEMDEYHNLSIKADDIHKKDELTGDESKTLDRFYELQDRVEANKPQPSYAKSWREMRADQKSAGLDSSGRPTLKSRLGSERGMALFPSGQGLKYGTSKLYAESISPHIQELRQVANNFLNVIHPARNVPREAMKAFFGLKGEKTLNIYRYEQLTMDIQKHFDDHSFEYSKRFIDNLMLGKDQGSATLNEYARFYRILDDQLYREILKYSPGLPYWEDHWRTIYKVPPGKVGELNRVIIESFVASRKPIGGSKGFLRPKFFETLSAAMDKGAIPASTNPAILFEMHYADVQKFLTFNRMLDFGKKSGLITWVKSEKGAMPPDGFTHVTSPEFVKYFRSGRIMGKGGEYFVEENFARALNNYISRDAIRQGDFGYIGRGLMSIKNHYTSMELSLNLFHAAFEGIETLSSNMAIGLREMWNLGIRQGVFGGEPEMAKYIGKGIGDFFASFAAYPLQSHWKVGKRALQGMVSPEEFMKTPEGQWLLKSYPDYMDKARLLFDGGLLPGVPENFRLNTIRSIQDAWRSGTMGGKTYAIAMSPMALNQFAMKPLFEWYIPRLKWGLAMRELTLEMMERSGELKSGKITPEEISRKTVAFVEDRLGEMNFDNLMWNRTFKSILQLAARSITWKLGNFRAIGGAFTGQGKEMVEYSKVLGKLARGEKLKPGEYPLPLLHRNFAWLMGMSMFTAVVGGTTHKILSGKNPTDLNDFVNPRYDPDNLDLRFSMATYAKDLVHMTRDPLGYLFASLSGVLTKSWEILHNKDYAGNQIWGDHDPRWEKLGKGALHLFPRPFGPSGVKRLYESGASVPRMIASMSGFPEAPRYASQDRMEEEMMNYLRGRMPEAGRTPEEAEKSRAINRITKLAKAGKDIGPVVEMGIKRGILDEQDIKDIPARLRDPEIVVRYRKINDLQESIHLYNIASEEKRAILGPELMKKMENAIKTRPSKISRLEEMPE